MNTTKDQCYKTFNCSSVLPFYSNIVILCYICVTMVYLKCFQVTQEPNWSSVRWSTLVGSGSGLSFENFPWTNIDDEYGPWGQCYNTFYHCNSLLFHSNTIISNNNFTLFFVSYIFSQHIKIMVALTKWSSLPIYNLRRKLSVRNTNPGTNVIKLFNMVIHSHTVIPCNKILLPW